MPSRASFVPPSYVINPSFLPTQSDLKKVSDEKKVSEKKKVGKMALNPFLLEKITFDLFYLKEITVEKRVQRTEKRFNA